MSDELKNTAENSENGENTEINEQQNSTTSEAISDSSQDDAVNKLLDELSETKDKYIRLTAEFDNFRKRTARENIELRKTAAKDVIISLLEVIDNCDRAEQQLQAAGKDDASTSGVLLVFQQLRKVLADNGVVAIDAKGKDFDVELHEAITEVPAPTEDMVGKVIDEVQKGYLMNDKLIRHAKVVVGKAAE